MKLHHRLHILVMILFDIVFLYNILLKHLESPAMVVGNGVTGIPDDLARELENISSYNWIEYFFYLGDFDPPVTIHEHQNGNESDTSSDDGRFIFSIFGT